MRGVEANYWHLVGRNREWRRQRPEDTGQKMVKAICWEGWGCGKRQDTGSKNIRLRKKV